MALLMIHLLKNICIFYILFKLYQYNMEDYILNKNSLNIYLLEHNITNIKIVIDFM